MPNDHFWIQYEAMPRHWRCVHCDLVNFSEGQPEKCHCEMNEERPWWAGIFWTAVGSFAGLFVAFGLRCLWKAIYG